MEKQSRRSIKILKINKNTKYIAWVESISFAIY